MSEQEKKSSTTGAGGSVVMVEQTPDSRHKPYRPTELQEEGQDLPIIRSRAPAVPLAASDDIKSTTVNERRESEDALSSDKPENKVTKKFSSKKRISSPEIIPLKPLGAETKKDESSAHPLPIAAQKIAAAVSQASTLSSENVAQEKEGDENSITEDIGELRTPEVDTKHSEWSDEEEAGGLPRSDSRSSRVSRAMRQLFCCGFRYEAPSEHNMSAREQFTTGI